MTEDEFKIASAGIGGIRIAAARLVLVCGATQQDAAELIGVSQPVVSRCCAKIRRNLAERLPVALRIAGVKQV